MEKIVCPKTKRTVWEPRRTAEGRFSRVISDFKEESELGRGGFGSVVKVTSRIDDQEYAIKKVKVLKSEGYEFSVREVKTMSRLCHPNVVRYHCSWLEDDVPDLSEEEDDEESTEGGDEDVTKDGSGEKAEDGSGEESKESTDGTADSSETEESSGEKSKESTEDEEYSGEESTIVPLLCIQLELCHGNNLRHLIAMKLPEGRIWLLFKQLVSALDYIHSMGIRHGDLSAVNVFFDRSLTTPKIGDFGLATALDGELEKGNYGPKTFYCPPELREFGDEQLKGTRRSYSSKSDIYSLGIILLEMFAGYSIDGEHPDLVRAHELSKFIQEGEWPNSVASLDKTTRELIILMTAIDPSERPTTKEILRSIPEIST